MCPCLGAGKTRLRKSRSTVYHQGVMVRKTDRKGTIKDKWQTLNHRNLGAMVLQACDQVRKVNEDELRLKGNEGGGEKAFQAEVVQRPCGRGAWSSGGTERTLLPACLLYLPSLGHLPPCMVPSLLVRSLSILQAQVQTPPLPGSLPRHAFLSFFRRE